MATNEELVIQLQAAGAGTPKAQAIMAQLWEQNQCLIKKVVHKQTGLSYYEDGFEDMLHQSYFGLHAAAFAFNAAGEVKFVVYMVNCIRWGLYQYYENNGYAVRIPYYMLTRIKNYHILKREMEEETGHSVSCQQVLKKLQLPPRSIGLTLKAIKMLKTVSFDAPCAEGEEEGSSLQNIVSDAVDVEELVIGMEWQRELHALLGKALRELPIDERTIIIRRYYEDVSYKSMAREYHSTRQAVCSRAQKGLTAMRCGRYGNDLTWFALSFQQKSHEEQIINMTLKDMEQLNHTDEENELLAP